MNSATSMASCPRQPAQGQNVSEKNQGTELDELPWLLKEIISAMESFPVGLNIVASHMGI
jgi:hypothetical protein